jgi:hypothetical protein
LRAKPNSRLSNQNSLTHVRDCPQKSVMEDGRDL